MRSGFSNTWSRLLFVVAIFTVGCADDGDNVPAPPDASLPLCVDACPNWIPSLACRDNVCVCTVGPRDNPESITCQETP